MKKLLFVLTFILTSSLFGQSDYKGTIITHYFGAEHMNWSNLDDKWIFTPNVERARRSCNWKIELNEDRSGDIIMEDLVDGQKYYMTVYDYKLDKIGTNDGIVCEVIQKFDGQKCTIMIQKGEAGQMIGVFMPESNLYLIYDNMRF